MSFVHLNYNPAIFLSVLFQHKIHLVKTVVVYMQCLCLKAELDEASTALDAARRLSEQLDRKEAMISALRDEGTAVAATVVLLLVCIPYMFCTGEGLDTSTYFGTAYCVRFKTGGAWMWQLIDMS